MACESLTISELHFNFSIRGSNHDGGDLSLRLSHLQRSLRCLLGDLPLNLDDLLIYLRHSVQVLCATRCEALKKFGHRSRVNIFACERLCVRHKQLGLVLENALLALESAFLRVQEAYGFCLRVGAAECKGGSFLLDCANDVEKTRFAEA